MQTCILLLYSVGYIVIQISFEKGRALPKISNEQMGYMASCNHAAMESVHEKQLLNLTWSLHDICHARII